VKDISEITPDTVCVDLAGRRLSEDDTTALVAALEANTALEDLIMDGCVLEQPALLRIIGALPWSVYSLSLLGVPIDQRAAEVLATMIVERELAVHFVVHADHELVGAVGALITGYPSHRRHGWHPIHEYIMYRDKDAILCHIGGCLPSAESRDLKLGLRKFMLSDSLHAAVLAAHGTLWN